MYRLGHGRPGWLMLPAWMLLLLSPLIVGGCISNAPTGGPGGHRDEAALRRIRVLLCDETVPVTVALGGPFHILDAAGKVLSSSSSAMSLSVAADPQGAVLVNGRQMPADCRIVPGSDGALQFGSHSYHGSLTVLNRQGRLYLINYLDIEQYLPGVVSGELFGKFHPEAFKAQAVAARTYALYQKFVNPRPDWDVTDTQASQVYIGVGTVKAVEAVRATYGRVLTWHSPSGQRIFCTYFSSTCGGVTSSVSNLLPVATIPPLAGGVQCDGCKHANYYTWPAVSMSRQDVTRKLRARHPQVFGAMGTIVRIEAAEATPEGRLVWLVLTDGSGQQARMRAAQFRLAVGPSALRSTWCQVQNTQDGFVFSNGRGFGHAVGMCQWGADGLARARWNWRQILLHFYPTSSITKAY